MLSHVAVLLRPTSSGLRAVLSKQPMHDVSACLQPNTICQICVRRSMDLRPGKPSQLLQAPSYTQKILQIMAVLVAGEFMHGNTWQTLFIHTDDFVGLSHSGLR